MTSPNRLAAFWDTYTKGLKPDDLHRLFTRDTREAYRFFTRGVDADALKGLPWHLRTAAHIRRALFFAFTLKLSPARRIVFAASLFLAFIGLINLFRGFGVTRVGPVPFVRGPAVPGPLFAEGTWPLLFAFALMNLLVLLEVADRLSLKNDLEVARDIQEAMLPSGLYTAPGVEAVGMSRPANTVAATSTTSSRSRTAASWSRSATSRAKAAPLRSSWRCCWRCCARSWTRSSSRRTS